MSFCFISGKQFSLATPANDKWLRDDLHEQWMMTYETFTFLSINFLKIYQQNIRQESIASVFYKFVTNGLSQQ